MSGRNLGLLSAASFITPAWYAAFNVHLITCRFYAAVTQDAAHVMCSCTLTVPVCRFLLKGAGAETRFTGTRFAVQFVRQSSAEIALAGLVAYGVIPGGGGWLQQKVHRAGALSFLDFWARGGVFPPSMPSSTGNCWHAGHRFWE